MAIGTQRIIDRARATFAAASADNAGLLAAGVAFYAFLAILPLLAAIVLIYGLVADASTVADNAAQLRTLLPNGAAELVIDQLQSVASADQGRTSLGLAIAIIAALWSATKGAKAVIVALNLVRGIDDDRGFIGRTLVSLVITAALAASAVGGIAAISALGFVDQLLPQAGTALLSTIRAVFWLCAALVAAWGLSLVYRYAPHEETRDRKATLPGAVAATVLWLGATFAFGIYTANFASYNATYGALGAVVVMLLWLYISAYVLILGAELNQVGEQRNGNGG